jgi:hypothetical protein
MRPLPPSKRGSCQPFTDPDWRELEEKIKAVIESADATFQWGSNPHDADLRRTMEAREVVMQVIRPLLCERLSHNNDAFNGFNGSA